MKKKKKKIFSKIFSIDRRERQTRNVRKKYKKRAKMQTRENIKRFSKFFIRR